MEPRPKIGVPRILGDEEIWKQAPHVTLRIDGENGEIVEVRTEDGSEPTVTRTVFTAPSEADDQAEFDATTF